MSVLAVIPARGGSKGLPGKNIRELRDRPLIAWSIVEALKSVHVTRVVVSTDDPEIASVARQWGAEVPFMRPADLASDDAPGVAPALHAIGHFPEYDWVLLLQPTSPLRTAADIDECIDLALRLEAPSVVSVCEARDNPNWMFHLGADGVMLPITEGDVKLQRQSLDATFSLNGALYLAQTAWINSERAFISPQTIGFVMPLERSVDIDTELDWQWAEFLLQKMDV